MPHRTVDIKTAEGLPQVREARQRAVDARQAFVQALGDYLILLWDLTESPEYIGEAGKDWITSGLDVLGRLWERQMPELFDGVEAEWNYQQACGLAGAACEAMKRPLKKGVRNGARSKTPVGQSG
jgi:hypothetical protein